MPDTPADVIRSALDSTTEEYVTVPSPVLLKACEAAGEGNEHAAGLADVAKEAIKKGDRPVSAPRGHLEAVLGTTLRAVPESGVKAEGGPQSE